MQLASGKFSRRTLTKIVAAGIILAFAGYLSYRLLTPRSTWETSSIKANGAAPEPPFNFTGAGSCSSTACHGGVTPRTVNRVFQNEFSTWILNDRHARAYSLLLEPRSAQIAKNLRIERAERSARCLACHALNVAPELQTKTFDLTDGVSCESCHGPAEGWLSEHTRKDWKHEDSIKRGMVDLRDVVHRAEKCSNCHLGNEEKSVDHELIAAGHPDLFFELDTFSALMPAHWNEQSWMEQRERDPWFATRAWAVSQAVALRDFMRLIASRQKNQPWPDFSQYECYACHHDLVLPSWRQARGYSAVAGRPTWNPSRYLILKHLARVASLEEAKALDGDLANIGNLLSNSAHDREKIAAAATGVAERADRLARSIARMPIDQEVTLGLIRSIAGDGQEIALGGVRSVEQAAMTLESLFNTYSRSVKDANPQAVKEALKKLFDDLEQPRNFEPKRFASRLQEVRRVLG